MKVNRVAKKEIPCYRCGHIIKPGELLARYRERAVSSHEASHAGTAYPFRRICKECAEKSN